MEGLDNTLVPLQRYVALTLISPLVPAYAATASGCLRHPHMPQGQKQLVGFDDVRKQRSILVYQVSEFVWQCRRACS